MYDELNEQINKKLKKCLKYVSVNDLDYAYIMLLYLKYLCDKEKYEYENIIKANSIENFINEFNPILRVVYNRFKDSQINKLLLLIRYEDLKELIREFIDYKKENNINLIDKNKKIIYLTNKYQFDIYDLNASIYASYSTDFINARGMELFKVLDEMLGVKHEYKKAIEKENIDENTIIYISDDLINYRYQENSDILSIAYKYVFKYPKTEVILETRYRKVATLKYKRYYDKLRRVIMIKDIETVYMQYNIDDSDKVSIIMYDSKNKSLDELKRIIKNDRKQKDVLVKVTKDEIDQNHGKIGFRIYQNRSEEERTINDIVDENSELINELTIINEQIKREIDILINR